MLGRRVVAIVLILVLALPLSGCWNRRELNTLGIVGLVGVDTGSDGVKATFEIIKPEKSTKSGGGKPEAPARYVQVEAKTFIETFRTAPLRFDRKLFVSHAKVVMFSEELARNGLAQQLDAVLRDHEMRLTMHLVIVKGSSATDVMGVASGINTIPSNYIDDLLKQHKVHAESVDSKVIDFLKSYTGKGINPVVSVLKKEKKASIGSVQSEEYELSAEGAAVFLKDRLVGFLDGRETRGYSWVTGQVKSGIVTFPSPRRNATTSVEILQASNKNDVEITDDGIKLKVTIKMNGMLDEQTTGIGLTDQKTEIALLEQATAQAIKQEVEHTLQKVQTEYRSDIFGFGQVVHRKYPREWKSMQDHWDDLFAQAAIEVKTEVEITKTGKSSYPVKE